MSEHERLAAAASQQDFGEIYELLAPRVRGYLAIRGSEDPEGLTNEVFIRTFAKVGELTGGVAGLRAFVFTVARGVLVDEWRKRARQPAYVELKPDRDPRRAESAEALALKQDPTSGPIGLLSLLPDDEREVIILKVLGELDIREVATTLGLRERQVRKLQQRALGHLRLLMDVGHEDRSGEEVTR